MSIQIQFSELFKEKLQKGICIFAGAGFSTLVSPSGNKLPTGEELCDELISRFSLDDLSKNDGLSYISEFCPEMEYQNYLRERFTVSDYNPLYNALNKIKINAFITTNVDNILRLVVDNGSRYYLKNIREYGATTGGPNELTYIPLHGDVTDYSSKLFFGKFDLSGVDKMNRDLFAQMLGTLSGSAILFWGYNFNDSGVLKVVKDLIEKKHSDIWVQVLPDDSKNQKLFEEKGCNIIKANTKELLQWINGNCTYKEASFATPINNPALDKYRIPAISKIPVVPAKDYYQRGITEWYPIIKSIPYERRIVSEAEDLVLGNKNVIISGCHFSGKTTALMQLAKKASCANKYYIEGVTKEEAAFIVKKTEGHETWIFFNNCCNDVEAYLVFAKSSNIKIIGTSDDYLLETVKHILSQQISYKVLNCSEISKNEARKMYDSASSKGLTRNAFVYKSQADEKYTMFEFISNNIEKASTQKHISNILKTLKSRRNDLFRTVALASYMSRYSSAISYQNVANLLNINVYPDAFDIIKQVKNYLRTYNIAFNGEFENQDFYVLRSKMFNSSACNILVEEYREEFGDLIKWLVTNESAYSILRYDIFRRRAFDSELFKKIFSYNDAMKIYNYLYEREANPYTLQQMALCQSLFGDYTNAFNSIDHALNLRPNNFSFKNSQAIILFESNHSNRSVTSIKYMKQAMSILEQCYTDDKRKLYHAQKYAQFALIMSHEYEIDDYLRRALDWLNEMTENDNNDSPHTRNLKEKISNKLSTIV